MFDEFELRVSGFVGRMGPRLQAAAAATRRRKEIRGPQAARAGARCHRADRSHGDPGRRDQGVAGACGPGRGAAPAQRLCCLDSADEMSHFDRFLDIYRSSRTSRTKIPTGRRRPAFLPIPPRARSFLGNGSAHRTAIVDRPGRAQAGAPVEPKRAHKLADKSPTRSLTGPAPVTWPSCSTNATGCC